MISDSETARNPRVLLAVSGVALAVSLAAALDSDFYKRLAADAFFTLTLAGFTFVFISISARPLLDAFKQTILAAILVALEMLVLKVPFHALPALGMLGVAGFLLVAVRRTWSEGERAQLLQYAFLPPLLLVLVSYWGPTLLGVTGNLHPMTMDLFLYDFDQSLGVQLSCKVGQIVLRSHYLTLAAVAFYYTLPLALMFVYSRQLLRDRSAAMTAFLAFLITGPLGLVFYNLVPACGPIYLLRSRFPFDPFSVQQLRHLLDEPVAVSGPRNAFPSLHMCWALLALWYSNGLSLRARLPLFLFLVGTLLAILGLGEHYFVDLVAAFPLALMIEAGCSLQVSLREGRRFVAFGASLILLLGWVVLFRTGKQVVWTSVIAPWSLIVFTLALSLLLHSYLRDALRESYDAMTRKTAN